MEKELPIATFILILNSFINYCQYCFCLRKKIIREAFKVNIIYCVRFIKNVF